MNCLGGLLVGVVRVASGGGGGVAVGWRWLPKRASVAWRSAARFGSEALSMAGDKRLGVAL
jgi:hypothetical protein